MLPVSHGGDVVDAREKISVVAQHVLHLLERPDVEAPFLPVLVGVEDDGEGTLVVTISR